MQAKPSGKFVIRIPKELHIALKKEAAHLDVSLNEHCLRLLTNRYKNSTDNQVTKMQTNLSKRFGNSLVGIVMFGSQVRGDSHDQSDIDLLVALDNSVPISRDLYRDLEDDIDPPISLHFAHLPENVDSSGSIFLECAIEGIILYDPKGLLNNLLKTLKSYILLGKAIRKETHGQGFWIHV